MIVPKSLFIDIDHEEKRALTFPKVLFWRWNGRVYTIRLEWETDPKKRPRMPFGDYALRDWHHVACGERKGSVGELHSNLFTNDSFRFHRAWKRLLAGTLYPALLLDIAASDFDQPSEYVKFPHEVLDRTLRLGIEYRVPILWLPPSKSTTTAARTGEYVARWLWNSVWWHNNNERFSDAQCENSTGPCLPAGVSGTEVPGGPRRRSTSGGHQPAADHLQG